MRIDILQTSFDRVRLDSANFAALFYQKLFLDHPQLKPLFADTDIKRQEEKLMTALVMIIDNLCNFPYLENLLKSLGARHIKYGVDTKHYRILGETLFKTLEYYLEKDWTLEVKLAWKEAYYKITDLMIEGAREENDNQSNFFPYLPSLFDKLRAEAIAQKALRDGYSVSLVTEKLMADYCFQDVIKKLGKEKTLELISDLIRHAMDREFEYNHNRVKLS